MEGRDRGLIQGTISAFAWRDRGKLRKSFVQDNLSLGRDLNPKPPEYEAGMLATH
jgi:hypothetical protein